MIELFADGACSPNPGLGGWAACFYFNNELCSVYGYVENTTNNRMELYSVIQGLEAVNRVTSDTDITVYSDSQYLVNTMNNNWSRAKNEDLWQRIDFAAEHFNIKWVWVKGHSATELNRMCDELAVKARKKKLIYDYEQLAKDMTKKQQLDSSIIPNVIKQEVLNRNYQEKLSDKLTVTLDFLRSLSSLLRYSDLKKEDMIEMIESFLNKAGKSDEL